MNSKAVTRRREILKRTVAPLVLALAVAACGGGSTTPVVDRPNNQPPPPPPPPPPSPTADEFRTFEYSWDGDQYALDAINAADAYAAGYTGEGITIGIVDFNFDLNSSELDISPLSLGPDADSKALYEAQIGEAATTSPHGHAVAVVAAGLKNDIDTHGVAFDAEVLLVDYFSGVNDTHETFNGVLYHIANPWTYLTNNGVRVINKSFGYDEDDIISNPPVVSEAYVNEYDAYAVAGGALLVVSAGNASENELTGDPEPSLSVLETLEILSDSNLLNSGPGSIIIAGAVDQNNEIAWFSDRAGPNSAANYFSLNHYLVAPGVDILAPYDTDTDGPGIYFLSGTSFAAPIISGAAAILFQRWPSLTAREVANILFDSATDLGAPGTDPVYGRGLLNLQAALQPIGNSTIAVAGLSAGPLVVNSGINLGPAFGDAAGLRAELSSVMMLDGYGRDFQIDLTGSVSTQATLPRLEHIVDARRNWRVSGLTLGERQSISFAVSEDQRETRALAFLSQAARDHGPQRDIVVRFSGEMGGFDIAAGLGQRLSNALAPQPFGQYGGELLSITGALDPAIDSGAGSYALAGFSLGSDLDLQIGASIAETKGADRHPVRGLREDRPVYTVAARADYFAGSQTRLSMTVGAFSEDGAVLGSRAEGALGLTNQATTTWLSLEAVRFLGERFALSVSMSGSATDPGHVRGSLFADMGTIVSSSFSARLSGRDILKKGDMAMLSVHQPLRVERAPVTIVSGIALDRLSGDVLFGEDRLSLAPSGREIAFETAYRTHLGAWTAEANVAWRLDANHVAGQKDAAVLLGFSRTF